MTRIWGPDPGQDDDFGSIYRAVRDEQLHDDVPELGDRGTATTMLPTSTGTHEAEPDTGESPVVGDVADHNDPSAPDPTPDEVDQWDPDWVEPYPLATPADDEPDEAAVRGASPRGAIFVGYQPATACTDGPTPGARALMAWFLGAYAGLGGKNLGIYNCRTVRGGTTTSLHGEGRACDLGINPLGAAYGTTLANRLRLSSAELGIQCLIWNRQIWSGSYPNAGWRPYTGVADHRDHIHAELTRQAANTLTAARIQQVLGGSTPTPTGDDELDSTQARMLAEVHAELTKRLPSRADYKLIGLTAPNPPITDTCFGMAANSDARAFEARELAGRAWSQARLNAEQINQLSAKLDQLLAAIAAGGQVATIPAQNLQITLTGTAVPKKG